MSLIETPNGVYDQAENICVVLKDPRANGLQVNAAELRRLLNIIDVDPRCFLFVTDVLPLKQTALITANNFGVTIALNRAAIVGNTTAHFICGSDQLIRNEVTLQAADIFAENFAQNWRSAKTLESAGRMVKSLAERDYLDGIRPRVLHRPVNGCARA